MGPPGFLYHQIYMQQALVQARNAGAEGEIPVGAVVVDPAGALLAAVGNRRERDHDPTAHAEILALRQAGQQWGSWYLQGCSLYVTLEPCPMCAAAIAQARISTLIYGADDPKAGAVRSVLNLYASPAIFASPQVMAGICEAECRALLREWFAHLRQD
jgi:tRNA(adenine34) deaminase